MAANQVTVAICARSLSDEVRDLVAHVHRHGFLSLVVLDAETVPAAARSLPGKVLARPLNGDFAAQRNWALTQIDTPWAGFLDADEFPSVKLLHEALAAITSDEVDAVWVQRRDWFLGRWLRFGEGGKTKLLRFARLPLGRDAWQRAVHEVWVIPTASSTVLPSLLDHRPATTITAFQAKLAQYAQLEVRTATKQSRVRLLAELLTFPPGKFLHAVLLQGVWRDGMVGIFHALLMAQLSAWKRIMRWEAWYARTQ